MTTPEARVQEIIARDAEIPISEAVRALAEAARARHGSAICGTLFYGSCLRGGDDEGKLVDLYLIAESYEAAHRSRLSAALNRLLPPNVYYLEVPFGDRTARAKYGIISLDHLERLVRPETLHPYFWARLAQPAALVRARDAETGRRVGACLAQAVLTLVGATRPLLGARPSPVELWTRAFSETYRTELRAERPGRSDELYAHYSDRYDALAAALPGTGAEPSEADRRRCERQWRTRRIIGKLLSVARLVKAAFTFENGGRYILWKIERHSGVAVEPTPWQERHPLLASPLLAWRIYRRGGFR